jgi:hypothetical protein
MADANTTHQRFSNSLFSMELRLPERTPSRARYELLLLATKGRILSASAMARKKKAPPRATQSSRQSA